MGLTQSLFGMTIPRIRSGVNSFGSGVDSSGRTAVPGGGSWAGVKKGTPSAGTLKMGDLHFETLSDTGVSGRETEMPWCGWHMRFVR